MTDLPDDFEDAALRNAPPDEQRDAMEQWFRERFEDPAQRTPYESREGGYLWIWGGPHDAEYELRSRFEGIVPDDVIESLASDLSRENPGWAPTERPGDYDDAGLYEAVRANSAAYLTLTEALGVTSELLDAQMDAAHQAHFRRLLFANVITALETYLADSFINRTLARDELIQKYIESDPAFKDRKVLFKDLRRAAAELETTVRRELLDVVWHNVGKLKLLFASVLGVDLGELGIIPAAIQMRHDIVHRNGRTKNGTMIEILPADVMQLSRAVEALASMLEDALPDEDFDDDLVEFD